MSTKENWDDSSDEEIEEEGCFDCTTEPLYEAKEEYHEARFTEEANENDYTDEEEADPIDDEEKSSKKVDSTNYESEEYEEDYDDFRSSGVDPQDALALRKCRAGSSDDR